MAGKAYFYKVSPDIIHRPEVCDLARGLNMPVFAAVGAASLLYAWGFEHADADGGINDFTAKAIESACGWDGERGGLIAMFCAAGILNGDPGERDEDDPLRIAGWEDIAAELNKVREQTRKRVARHRENAKNVTPFVPRGETDAVTRYETRDVTDAVTRPRVENRDSDKKRSENREDDSFDRFWSAYPRKVAKSNAEKAWRKIKPDAALTQRIIDSIERFKRDPQWAKDDGQFIPHPATFLNGRRWEDHTEVNLHGRHEQSDQAWDDGLDEEGREALRTAYARECMQRKA